MESKGYEYLEQAESNVKEQMHIEFRELAKSYSNPYTKELVEKLEQEYLQYYSGVKMPKSINQAIHMQKVMEQIRIHGTEFPEFDAETLLQFKKPLEVLADLYLDNGQEWSRKLDKMMQGIYSRDVLTLPYGLERARIMPETYSRHQAIHDILRIVPDPDFHTMMSWLDLYRAVYVEGVERENEEPDPYTHFVECLVQIKKQFGDNILQQVFDTGKDNPVCEDELIYIAQYLQSGGDAADIQHMMNTGEWDTFRVECEEAGIQNIGQY